MHLDRFHLEAHKYIGVPFIHRGRTDRGLDCVGLVILAARDCGYDRYKEFAYGSEPESAVLRKILKEHFGLPVDGGPQINDLVLIRLRPAIHPTHVGIITDHPHGLGIIHTHSKLGEVVYTRIDEQMIHLLAAVYRWPNEVPNG